MKKGLSIALKMLSKKQYSRQEIINKLKTLEIEEQTIDTVIEYLDELNLLDDEEYAKNLVEYYKNRRIGVYKIREELRKRYIDRETIDNVLCDFETDFDALFFYFQSRIADDISDFKKIQKTFAYLSNKGFKNDEIQKSFTLYKEQVGG